jgi:murein L,D-transpeptidase YafK
MSQTGNISIFIDKAARTLHIYRAAALARSVRVALGRNALANKVRAGDCATPLGEFYVCARNPRSKFFLSLCLSYPNREHALRGLQSGLINTREYTLILAALAQGRMPPQDTALGGEIYIHGELPAGRDWTHGCIALDNPSMQELFDIAAIGTKVSIRP